MVVVVVLLVLVGVVCAGGTVVVEAAGRVLEVVGARVDVDDTVTDPESSEHAPRTRAPVATRRINRLMAHERIDDHRLPATQGNSNHGLRAGLPPLDRLESLF